MTPSPRTDLAGACLFFKRSAASRVTGLLTGLLTGQLTGYVTGYE